MAEKRKFDRFDLNIPSRIEISTHDGESELLDIETNSLSAGGMFFKCGRTLPKGYHVKVEIALHFDELKASANSDGTLVITATGHVLRSGPEGMAISFNEDFDISPTLSCFIEKQYRL